MENNYDNNTSNTNNNKLNYQKIIEIILSEFIPTFTYFKDAYNNIQRYDKEFMNNIEEVTLLISTIKRLMQYLDKSKLKNNEMLNLDNYYEKSDYLYKTYISSSQSDMHSNQSRVFSKNNNNKILNGDNNNNHLINILINSELFDNDVNNANNDFIGENSNINEANIINTDNTTNNAVISNNNNNFNNNNMNNIKKSKYEDQKQYKQISKHKLIQQESMKISKLSIEMIKGLLILILQDLLMIKEQIKISNTSYPTYKNLKILNRFRNVKKIIFSEHKIYDYKLLHYLLHYIISIFCRNIEEVVFEGNLASRIDQVDIMLKNGVILYFLSIVEFNKFSTNNKIEFINENIHSKMFYEFLLNINNGNTKGYKKHISNNKKTMKSGISELNNNENGVNKNIYNNNANTNNINSKNNNGNENSNKYNKNINDMINTKNNIIYKNNNYQDNNNNNNNYTDFLNNIDNININKVLIININLFNVLEIKRDISSINIRNITQDKSSILESTLMFLQNNPNLTELTIDRFTVIPSIYKEKFFTLLEETLINLNRLKIVILNSDYLDIFKLLNLQFSHKKLLKISLKFPRLVLNFKHIYDELKGKVDINKSNLNKFYLYCEKLVLDSEDIKNQSENIISINTEKIYYSNYLKIKNFACYNTINSNINFSNKILNILFNLNTMTEIRLGFINSFLFDCIIDYFLVNKNKSLRKIKLSLIESFDENENSFNKLLNLISSNKSLKEYEIENLILKYSYTYEEIIKNILNEALYLKSFIIRISQPFSILNFPGFYYYEYPFFLSFSFLYAMKKNLALRKIYKRKNIIKGVLNFYRFKVEKNVNISYRFN